MIGITDAVNRFAPADEVERPRKAASAGLMRLPSLAPCALRAASAALVRSERRGAPGLDPRGLPKSFRPRDLVDPTLRLESIQVKTRDFR